MSNDSAQVVESNSARKRRLANEYNASRVTTETRTAPTPQEKEELNALSKEVFGASSRWQKLISRGYAEVVTETITEYVPGEKEEDEGTTREVQVPVKYSNGAHKLVTKRHTVESVKQYMLERKKQLDAMRAEIKRRQEEERSKKEQEQLAKKVHEELQGSAV